MKYKVKYEGAVKRFCDDWREVTQKFFVDHFMYDGVIDFSAECYKEMNRLCCQLPQIYIRHKCKDE